MAPSSNTALNGKTIFDASKEVSGRRKSSNSISSLAPLPEKKWAVVLMIAGVIAMCVSGYLAYVGLTASKIAGCGDGQLFNCSHVTNSRWSSWFGIPVSLLAVGVYVGLLSSLFVGASNRFSNTARQAGWALTSVFGIAAGLSALWFVSLQVFVLNHLCTYCLVAHACGVVIASIVVWQRPVGFVGMKTISSVSFAGLAILVGGQLFAEPPKPYEIQPSKAPAAGDADAVEFEAPFAPPTEATATPEVSIDLPTAQQIGQGFAAMLSPASMLNLQINQTSAGLQVQQEPTTAEPKKANKRMVAINGGTVKLDVAQWPVAGSPSAKYMFVEMFDYSCPHCRHTHAAIKKAKEKLSGEVAVVVLPVPLNAACNSTLQTTGPAFAESCEISKLAVAVWRVDPAKFTEFHNWMFAADAAPSYASAKAQAARLVAMDKLDREIASGVPAQYLTKTVELFKMSGKGQVPKLMFPTTSVVGEYTSADGLVDMIKQNAK